LGLGVDARLLGEQDPRGAILGVPDNIVRLHAAAVPVDELDRFHVGADGEKPSDVDVFPIKHIVVADADNQPIVVDPFPPVDVDLAFGQRRRLRATEQGFDNQ